MLDRHLSQKLKQVGDMRNELRQLAGEVNGIWSQIHRQTTEHNVAEQHKIFLETIAGNFQSWDFANRIACDEDVLV